MGGGEGGERTSMSPGVCRIKTVLHSVFSSLLPSNLHGWHDHTLELKLTYYTCMGQDLFVKAGIESTHLRLYSISQSALVSFALLRVHIHCDQNTSAYEYNSSVACWREYRRSSRR